MTNTQRFVKRVMDELDTSETLTYQQYIDALEELIFDIECRLNAAKESE